MEIKTVNFRTNYNNKLDCHYFIHVDLAPAQGTITETILSNTVIVIQTIDNSHPPVKTKLYDLARLPLKNLSDNTTKLSHGITRSEFLKLLQEKKGVEDDTELAIYYYRKEDASA
jgi:hypothetical protein